MNAWLRGLRGWVGAGFLLLSGGAMAMQGTTLGSPSAGAVITLNDTNNPCFSWAKNPEASYYNLQLSLTPDFPTQRWLKVNLTSTSACWNNGSGWDPYGTSPLPVPVRLEPGKTYYWRVVSLNAPLGSQTDSMVSAETRTFTVKYGLNIQFDSPRNDDDWTTENPAFTWTVSGYPVTGFDLQLSTKSTMSDGWKRVNTLTATGWNHGSGWTTLSGGAAPTLLPDGLYYARVTAKIGSITQFSEVHHFTLHTPSAPGVPSYITVHQSDLKGNFTLKWGTASGYVDHYLLSEQFKGGTPVTYNVGTSLSKNNGVRPYI